MIFVASMTSEHENFLSSVYWNFHDNFYISLAGKVLAYKSKEEIEILCQVLEENSAKNLMKLFTSETIESATNGPNDPLASLIESLVRLGQISIDKCNEDGQSPQNIHSVYFQSSVVIGGKREYPFYIIKNEEIKVEMSELLEQLKSLNSFDGKAQVLNDFYIQNCPESDEIEFSIFNESNKIYELLYEPPVEQFEKMMKTLKADGLKLKYLLNEGEKSEIDFKRLEMIFNEMILTKIPSKKLKILVEFHSQLTQKPETNADVLLPLLTYVLINLEAGHEIGSQVKFIERFAHPINLQGLNNYILTSTVIIRHWCDLFFVECCR